MDICKILIVEDERVVAMAIEDTLVSEGYVVCGIAGSGTAALKSAAEHMPDLVLMDIRLRGAMDGIETADILKRRYHIPFIYLTAYSDRQLLERAKSTGPLAYILKPFTAAELRVSVEIALYQAEIEQKIQLMNIALQNKITEQTRMISKEVGVRRLTKEELQLKSTYLKKANSALKAMLENREAEIRAVEEDLCMTIRKIIFPYIEMLEKEISNPGAIDLVSTLKTALNDIINPVAKPVFSLYINLTPQEIKIAEFIRQGKTTKEIAGFINIAPSSISSYRNAIRKKMGLLNSSTNLETHLNNSKL